MMPDRTTSLGSLASRGFILLTSRSLIGRILAPLSQLILARLLLPADYGLISLAYTVTTLATIAQASGVREVLIRRHKHLRRWKDAGFWFAASLGLVSGLIVLAAAPVAASFYDEPALIGLLALMAAISPLASLTVVPQAALSAKMQFKRIFAAEAIDLFGWPILTVVFAYLGFGAYSFVIPRILLLLGQLLTYWWMSELPLPKLHMRFRRWRLLWRDVAMLMGSGFLLTLAGQLDRVILGRIADTAIVGVYFFAFSLAIQPLALFSGSIVNVLLPALSRLQDNHAQQRAAFLRASILAASVLIPICLFLGALAEPLILYLFGAKWGAAIWFMQILSIGVAFDAASAPSHAYIRAQGRFKVIFAHATFSSAFYLIIGWTLAQSFGPTGVAIAYVLNHVLSSSLLTVLALRGTQNCLLNGVGNYFVPVTLLIIPMVLIYGLPRLAPELGPLRTMVQLLAAVIAGVLYVAELRLVRPEVLHEIHQRFFARSR